MDDSDRARHQGSGTRPGLGRRNFLQSLAVGGVGLGAGFVVSPYTRREITTTAATGTAGASGGAGSYPGGSAYDAAVRKAVAGRTLKVGFAPPIISEFFKQMEHAAWWQMSRLESQFGVKWNWELAAPTGNFNAVQKQVGIIKDWVARRFDVVMVCTGANFSVMQNVYQEALARGTAVFQFNEPVKLYPENQLVPISSVGYNNITQSGGYAADFLAKKLHGEGTIIQILGPPGSDWRKARLKGFNQVLRNHPRLKVVAQGNGGYVQDKGYHVALDLLTRYPDVKAIWGENEDMGLGAVRAITKLGLQHWDGHSGIVTVAADGTLSGTQSIQNGGLTAVIDVGSVDQGITLINTVFANVVLGARVGKIVEVPTRLYTKDTVKQEADYLTWALNPPKTY